MNRLVLLLALFFCACSHPSRETAFLYQMPKAKVKKLKNLEEKISKTQIEKENAEKNLQTLQIKFYTENIKVINKKMNNFLQFKAELEKDEVLFQTFIEKELNGLFAQERKALIQIIENCPQAAPKAQNTLDAILRLITELSNKKKRSKIA